VQIICKESLPFDESLFVVIAALLPSQQSTQGIYSANSTNNDFVGTSRRKTQTAPPLWKKNKLPQRCTHAHIMEDQQHDLLEFGTSVSVNDELRRTLVSEAEELQQSVVKIERDIGLETKIRNQLAKDQSHAEEETKNLHHSSQRVHEDLSFLYHKSFLESISIRLNRELGSSLTEESIATEEENATDKAHGDDGVDDEKESKDEYKSAADKFQPQSIPGIRVTVVANSKKYENLRGFFQDANEKLENVKNQHDSAASKKKQLLQQLQELQSDLCKSQDLTKTVSCNLQEEEDRRRGLENDLREMELSYETILRETEEKVSRSFTAPPNLYKFYPTSTHWSQLSYYMLKKQLREQKQKEFLQRKVKLETDLAAMEENERRHVAAKQSKQAELESLQAQKKTLDQEYAEYCTWKATYEEQQKKCKTERQERQRLFSVQKEMENEWSTLKVQLDRLEKEVSREEKASKKLQAENSAAVKKHKEMDDEIARMQNEAEELEALLMQEDEPDPTLNVLESQENKLKQLQAELEATEKEIAEKDAILAEENHRLSEERRKYAEQVGAIQTERSNLEKSVADMRARIQQDEERRSDSLNQKRRYEVLKLAADAIASSKRKEQKYLQAPKPNYDDVFGSGDML